MCGRKTFVPFFAPKVAFSFKFIWHSVDEALSSGKRYPAFDQPRTIITINNSAVEIYDIYIFILLPLPFTGL